MKDATSDPPPGFKVTAAADGSCVILYRAPLGVSALVEVLGLGVFACLFVVAVCVWLFGFEVPDGWYWGMMGLPLVGACFFAALFVQEYWSVTRFAFEPDELVVQWSLWWFRRRRAFRRDEVTGVRQIKDGGAGDEPDTWGLMLVTHKEVPVLPAEPIDKSDWLGPIIARWAGVAFEPWEPDKPRNCL
jgi:hypothetical protein